MEIPVLAERAGTVSAAARLRGRRRPGGRRHRGHRLSLSARSADRVTPRRSRSATEQPETSHRERIGACSPSCRSCAPSARCGGSDLHCKVGSPPRVRIDGRLRKLQAPDLTPGRHRAHGRRGAARRTSSRSSPRPTRPTSPTPCPASAGSASTPSAPAARPAWSSAGSASARSRWTTSACRPVLSALAMEPRGLVLVTGPTGSGKTTTLAGMIDHINNNREVHVVTIEDPIEVLHFDKLVDDQPARGPRRHRRTSPPRCAPRCGRTPTSSSSARCATTRRSRRRWPPPRPATSSCRRCTPPTRRRPSTASSTSSRRTSRSRSGSSLAGALRGIICQRLVPARRRPGPLRRDGDLRQHRPHRRRHRRPGQDRHDRRS